MKYLALMAALCAVSPAIAQYPYPRPDMPIMRPPLPRYPYPPPGPAFRTPEGWRFPGQRGPGPYITPNPYGPQRCLGCYEEFLRWRYGR